MATLISWFVLSNHCAMGGMGSCVTVQKVHGCCHNDTSKPAEEPGGSQPGTECCKSLHAVVPNVAKLADAPSIVEAGAFIAWVITRDAQPQAVVVLFCDTGPPRAESFSELVLHRSLRSHAPPFLA